jgi:hypothetical protein
VKNASLPWARENTRSHNVPMLGVTRRLLARIFELPGVPHPSILGAGTDLRCTASPVETRAARRRAPLASDMIYPDSDCTTRASRDSTSERSPDQVSRLPLRMRRSPRRTTPREGDPFGSGPWLRGLRSTGTLGAGHRGQNDGRVIDRLIHASVASWTKYREEVWELAQCFRGKGGRAACPAPAPSTHELGARRHRRDGAASRRPGKDRQTSRSQPSSPRTIVHPAAG